jgi:uncharacterized protein
MKRQLAALVAAAALASAAPAKADQPIAMVSLPQGTINYFQTAAIAKVVQEHSNLTMRVKTMRGASLGHAAVNAGDAEFQISNIIESSEAAHGEGIFQGKPQKNLRVALENRALPLGIFVRKDSPIKTIADLKGKRFPTGWKAYPNVTVNINAILKTGGLSLDDVDPVPVPELIRASEDFKQGKSDASYFAVDAPKVREIDTSVGGIRFLSLPEGPKALADVQSVKPGLFIMKLQPNPRLPGIVGPTNVLAFDLVVITSARVPDEVVYQFVKAMHDNRAELVKAHPSFNQFKPERMAKRFSTLAHHPGAIKYYKEIGLWKEGG